MSDTARDTDSPSDLHNLSVDTYHPDDGLHMPSPACGTSGSMSNKRGRSLEDADSGSDSEVEDGIVKESDAAKVKAGKVRTKRSKKYSRHEISGTATWTGNKKVGQYITLPRYSKLFNKDAADLLDETTNDHPFIFTGKTAATSQPAEVYGIIPWTASELDLFFDFLGRKGRDDLAGIACGIGTKGELEVADLLRRLKEGYLDRQLNATILALPELHEIPAATEVSAEFEEVLNTAANAALRDEEEKVLLAEEEKVGAEFSVLDGDNAMVFYDDEAPGDEDTDDAEENKTEAVASQNEPLRAHSTDGSQFDEPQGDTFPDLNQPTLTAATQVLDFPRLLELSQYVFMNSADKAYHWQNLQRPRTPKPTTPRSRSRSRPQTPPTPQPSEESLKSIPGMHQSALLDLYNLVLNTTTGIASAAHFLASSRIRATDSKSGRSIRREVKRSDVKAALDILGTKHNSWDFWTKCPRKCGVSVYRSRRGERRQMLSYDEVERLLAKKTREVRKREYDEDGSDGEGSAVARTRSEDRTPDGEETEEVEDDSADDASNVSLSTHASSAASNSPAPDSIPDAPDPFPDSISDRTSSLSPEAAARDSHEHEAHTYADAVDLHASRIEEERLRAFLTGAREGLSRPSTAKSDKRQETTPSLPSKSKSRSRSNAIDEEGKRKTIKELRDWRDWVEYRAEWERFPRPLGVRRDEDWEGRDGGEGMARESEVVETIEGDKVDLARRDLPMLDGTGEDEDWGGSVESWEAESAGTAESRGWSEERRGRRRERT